MFNYFEECTALLVELQSSHAALAIDSSWSPLRFPLQMSDRIFCSSCKEAKLQARIKPTALCSAIDKENSIGFPLDFLHYLYNYYMVCVPFSHTYHVTHHVTLCDMML